VSSSKESVGYMQIVEGAMRTFPSGATRNDDGNKPDPEGFLSPLVLDGYSDYMQTHREQADGKLRASDNWQKGIPIEAYQKSLIRHVKVAWRIWRGYAAKPEQVGTKLVTPTLKDALYAVLFNVMGYLHELEKAELKAEAPKGVGALQGGAALFERLAKMQAEAEKDREAIEKEPYWPNAVLTRKLGPMEVPRPGSAYDLNDVPRISRYGAPAPGRGGAL
jgi:hypothetical protein